MQNIVKGNFRSHFRDPLPNFPDSPARTTGKVEMGRGNEGVLAFAFNFNACNTLALSKN